MILQINHRHRERAGVIVNDLVETVLSLFEDGRLDPSQFPHLRVQLDWIQYKSNFRETVMVRRGTTGNGAPLPLMEISVDGRQVNPETFRAHLTRVIERTNQEGGREPDRVFLEEFGFFRSSLAWKFNRLFWHHLRAWEQATGKSYEQALPGGKSDANHPAAVNDSVADFWTLLVDLEAHNQLPAEIFVLEIGVGTGIRAGMWLDRFRALDQERGSKFYPKLRFLLGDYSLQTLDRSRAALQTHLDLCSFLALDALNPIKGLSFLRHKVMHVHLTNVYDNLPDDELVRRDGCLYYVQVRSYLPIEDAETISRTFDIPMGEMSRMVNRLVEFGPDYFLDQSRGVGFWQAVWQALRLEERLVLIDRLLDVELPGGIDPSDFEGVLRDAPSDVRFQLSFGAIESFRNTLPLLHPRGYLQVQDIFVTNFSEYRQGFHGPGKLDGSIVSWVNGILMREIGKRTGYDVHFAPFPYRKGSRTSILFTTPRE
jgi:hypothetical protein